ncbi:MAG: hypothetical protein JSW60_07235 [Thermoplasmatales archaeon]|nr:MAG: hypothetical protein JSW60_07235 [Thermoplasmatales archaeon]
MKTKKSKAAIVVLGTISLPAMIMFSLFIFSIWALFHFDVLTRKVYIPLSGEYTIFRGCEIEP